MRRPHITLFRSLQDKIKGKLGPIHASRQGPAQATLTEGIFYKTWCWVLPLLLGLTIGWLAALSLELWLNRQVRTAGVAQAVAAPSTEKTVDTMNMSTFLTANPFKITPMTEPEVVDTTSEDVPVVITGDLATAILRGTHPGVGAWLEDKGQLHLILINSSFDEYTLERVTHLNATFRKDNERVVKELLYIDKQATAKSVTVRDNEADNARVAAGNAQVEAAEAEGKEGVVPAELIRDLMENPFDELKRVRLRPKDGEQGLQVQWINKDSVLSKLGVKKGDVIRSINGIAFKNMADITNSINSLMDSERFDVEVTRDGAATSLQYVVR